MADFHQFLLNIPQFLVLIPFMIMTCLPMRRVNKYSLLIIHTLWLVVFAITIPLAAIIKLCFSFDFGWTCYAFLLIYYFICRATVTASREKVVFFFFNNIALYSCLLNFAYAYDAYRNPYNGSSTFSLAASLVFLLETIILLLMVIYPFKRFGSELVDAVIPPKIWYTILVIPLFLTALNGMAVPQSYQSLNHGRVLSYFITLELILPFFYLFLDFLFYEIIISILNHSAQMEQMEILQVQAERYQSLQAHVEQSRKLRHDFKHSVHALSILASENNIDEIKKHLALFEQDLDTNSMEFFCDNPALNALFQYYSEMAEKAHVQTNWKIDLPGSLPITEIDLFGLIGNLLENAILSCQTVPDPLRYFSFTIDSSHKGELYLVSSNSFDGKVKKENNQYISTRKDGSGIGLSSIKNVCDKYHGSISVKQIDSEFDVDIMLQV